MQAVCNLSKSLLAALDPANTTTTWRISGMSCLKKGILTPKGITGTPSCVGQGTIWFIIYYILKLYLQESVRARTFTTICWSTFFYSRHHCLFELLILNETACFKCSFGMKTKFIYTCPGQKNVTATIFGQLHACFNQWRFAKHKARIQQQKPHCCKTVPTIYNPIRTCGRSSCFDKTKNTVPVCKFDCPRAPRPKLFFHVRHQQADALGARICSTMRQRCQPAKFWGMFSWLTQTWQFLSWHFGWWPNTWPLVHHRLQTSMQHKTMQFFSRTSAAGAAGKPETAKEISPWHPHHENKWPKNKLHTYVAKYVPTRAFYPSPQMIFFSWETSATTRHIGRAGCQMRGVKHDTVNVTKKGVITLSNSLKVLEPLVACGGLCQHQSPAGWLRSSLEEARWTLQRGLCLSTWSHGLPGRPARQTAATPDMWFRVKQETEQQRTPPRPRPTNPPPPPQAQAQQDNSGGGDTRKQQQQVEEFPHLHLQGHDCKGQEEQTLHAYSWGDGDGNRMHRKRPMVLPSAETCLTMRSLSVLGNKRQRHQWRMAGRKAQWQPKHARTPTDPHNHHRPRRFKPTTRTWLARLLWEALGIQLARLVV